MRLATILSDHPLGGYKRTEIGTTDAARAEAGYVFLSTVERKPEGFGIDNSVTTHYTPEGARSIAHELLSAADIAECELDLVSLLPQ